MNPEITNVLDTRVKLQVLKLQSIFHNSQLIMFMADSIHSSFKLNSSLFFPCASLFAVLHFCLRMIMHTLQRRQVTFKAL